MDNTLMENNLSKKESGIGLWLVFAIFVIVFLVGTVYLYYWWLDPWIRGVNTNGNNLAGEVVPGVDTTDADKDGLILKEETKLGTSDNLTDTDGDGLDDKKEVELGTNPNKADTDGDGYNDALEVNSKHNPLSAG